MSSLVLETSYSTGLDHWVLSNNILQLNFNSVLVGKASIGQDWNVTLACAVSILGMRSKKYFFNFLWRSITCNFVGCLYSLDSCKNKTDWKFITHTIVGLGGTLTLLSIYKKALPALPISITLGLIFYFSTAFIITPFMERCIVQQVFL